MTSCVARESRAERAAHPVRLRSSVSWAIQVFSAHLVRKQSLGFLVVAQPPQGRQHVGERRFFLLVIPGPEGKTDGLMARLVEPNHHQAVDEQRHRGGPLDRLGKTIGRVLQSQELLAVFKCAFDRPATGIGREDLPAPSNRAWCSRTSGRGVSLRRSRTKTMVSSRSRPAL